MTGFWNNLHQGHSHYCHSRVTALDPVKNSNTLVIDVKSHFSWLIFFKSDQIIRNGGQRV